MSFISSKSTFSPAFDYPTRTVMRIEDCYNVRLHARQRARTSVELLGLGSSISQKASKIDTSQYWLVSAGTDKFLLQLLTSCCDAVATVQDKI